MTSKPENRLKKVLQPKAYNCQAMERCNNEFSVREIFMGFGLIFCALSY